MKSNWASTQISLLLIALLTLVFQPAEARLGENYLNYRSKLIKAFKPQGQLGPNYLFQMNVNPKGPLPNGYAAGVTITVDNGKIVGESIAIRPGTGSLSSTVARLHGFAFIYDAIGKPIPKDKKQSDAEYKAFCGACDQALIRGIAQSLKYPGYNAQVTVSRSPTGDLLVAAKQPIISSPPK